MIADILILSAGFAAGWFTHLYRERIVRLKDRIKSAVDEELKS